MIPLTTEAQLNRAIKSQLAAKITGKNNITAELEYQVSHSNGKVEFHKGILPTQLPRDGSSLYIKTAYELPEEDYMDQADKGLRKGCRKRIQRAMTLLNVSEVRRSSVGASSSCRRTIQTFWYYALHVDHSVCSRSGTSGECRSPGLSLCWALELST